MSTSQPPASQSTPPPPPKSSSTPFIAAVVAMLLLIGGLLFWKLSGSKQAAPVATVAAPPSVAAAPPVLEAPPPPPPPPEPEAPDAGTEPNKGTKKVASTGGSGGCSAECTGTEAPQFRSQLQALAGRARGCYERALKTNEELGGRVMVSLKVGPSGQVCSANVTSNQTGDPGLSSCVAQIFRSATYAAPKNGCVDAQVPLNFVTKK